MNRSQPALPKRGLLLHVDLTKDGGDGMTPEREAEVRQAVECNLFYELPVGVVVDLLEALDTERERNAKLERVLREQTEAVDAYGEYHTSDTYSRLSRANTAALAALVTPEEPKP